MIGVGLGCVVRAWCQMLFYTLLRSYLFLMHFFTNKLNSPRMERIVFDQNLQGYFLTSRRLRNTPLTDYVFSDTQFAKKHYLQSSPKIKLICSQKLRLDSILQDLNEAFSNDEKHSTEKCQPIILRKCAFRINFFRFSNLTLTINDSFVSFVNVSIGSC